MSSLATDPAAATVVATLPAIRLVRAFREAVDASRVQEDFSHEAEVIEGLFLAAEGSYSALSGLANLWHRLTYCDAPSPWSGEEQVILDGYTAWLDAARPLRDRLRALATTGYESEAGSRFERACVEAEGVIEGAAERRRIEASLPSRDKLARLAAKFRKRALSENGSEGHP